MKGSLWKAALWILTSCFILSGSIVPSAASAYDTSSRTITLTIGGWISGNNLPPRLVNGRTFVTVTFISQLGAAVSLNRAKQEALIFTNETEILLTAGESFVTVNGQSQDTDSPSFWETNYLWVPLRFLAELLGWKVSWVQAPKEVILRKGTFSGPTVAFRLNGDLYLRDLETNAMRILGPASYNFCWSWDGESIAYYQTKTASGEPFSGVALHILNISTGSDQTVYSSIPSDQPMNGNNAHMGGFKLPSFDPLGEYILYDTPTSDYDGMLFRISLRDHSMAKIVQAAEGSFSSSGRYIAYIDITEEMPIGIFDRDGKNQNRIAGPGDSYCWHPGGQWIATGGKDEILVFDVSKPLQPIYRFPYKGRPMAWSDDGQWLACWGAITSETLEPFAISIPGGRIITLPQDRRTEPLAFLPGTHKLLLVHNSGILGSPLHDLTANDLDNPGKPELLCTNLESAAIRPN